MFTDYEVGQDVWIALGGPGLVKGRIVHYFTLPDYGYYNTQYIIEIPTSIDPILEVRDAATMSPSEDKPIGIWQDLADKLGVET